MPTNPRIRPFQPIQQTQPASPAQSAESAQPPQQPPQPDSNSTIQADREAWCSYLKECIFTKVDQWAIGLNQHPVPGASWAGVDIQVVNRSNQVPVLHVFCMRHDTPIADAKAAVLAKSKAILEYLQIQGRVPTLTVRGKRVAISEEGVGVRPFRVHYREVSELYGYLAALAGISLQEPSQGPGA